MCQGNVLGTSSTGDMLGTKHDSQHQPQPLSSTPGIVGKQMVSRSPKWVCLTHPPVFYLKSHAETFTKHVRAFAWDQRRTNPLKYLHYNFSGFFSWWLSREVPFQVVFRVLPRLLKAQLLVWMDANLSQSIFVWLMTVGGYCSKLKD